MIRRAVTAAPRAPSFLSCQKLQCSAPFSLRGKEKAAGGKKKTAKGDLRRNKLHIPHPVRRLRRTGVVRSVVPPFPTRIASLDSRGSPVPFANPLKRPRRGLRPPSLDFPRSLVCAEIIFGFIKRDADAYWTDRRCSRNTLRLFRMYLAWKSVCARYAAQPLQEGRPFDFHTSNIQRAQTKRLARYIVRLGNPILRPPEGRSLRDVSSVNGTQKQNAFSGASARFRVPSASFLPILFWQDRKEWAAGGTPFAAQRKRG